MMAHRWGRNLLGAAAVLATILVVVFGLPAIDRAIPANRSAPAQRHEIADGVSVIPPTGSLITNKSRNGPATGSVLFLIGPARYVVSVEPFDGDLDAAATRLRTKIQSMRGYQVTAGETALTTDSGLQGRGGSFTAPGRSGRYIAFIAPGCAVEVTVNVSETEFQQELLSIDESIASLAYQA
jgi:hypothetical protein